MQINFAFRRLETLRLDAQAITARIDSLEIEVSEIVGFLLAQNGSLGVKQGDNGAFDVLVRIGIPHIASQEKMGPVQVVDTGTKGRVTEHLGLRNLVGEVFLIAEAQCACRTVINATRQFSRIDQMSATRALLRKR